jgi:hypothetical protein
LTASRRNFRFDGYRHHFGPYAWVAERAALEKAGFLPSFLQPWQQCRGMWIDVAGVGHWKWFEKLSDAKQWVRMNATSKWAMK